MLAIKTFAICAVVIVTAILASDGLSGHLATGSWRWDVAEPADGCVTLPDNLLKGAP